LDEEMLALTLNGKKNKTKMDVFVQVFNSAGLEKSSKRI